MDDADGDLDAGGDGADGFAALAAGKDGGAFVVVDHGAVTTIAASATGGFEAVFGLADDVAAAVFGQGEGQVEDQGAFGVLAGRDALQHLDADAALEQVAEDDQSFKEVAAEPGDRLDGQQVAGTDVGQRVQQRGPVVGLGFAADLLLEDLPANRIQGVVLPLGVLLQATISTKRSSYVDQEWG